MKKIFYVIGITLVIVSSAYYYTFVYSRSHHRNVQEEPALVISSDSLVAVYQNNEFEANNKFLNKAVEVTGTILSLNKDQANHPTILIGKVDAFSNVSVTLISTTPIQNKVGESITVKGVCTGNLSDVIITEGVIK